MAKLTPEDILAVRDWLLKANTGATYVFAPLGVGNQNYSTTTPEEYLEWLHKQYPQKTFKYTCSMLSYSFATRIDEYLKVKWEMRDIGDAFIRHELINLREEIKPLRTLKEAVVAFREAEKKWEEVKRWVV